MQEWSTASAARLTASLSRGGRQSVGHRLVGRSVVVAVSATIAAARDVTTVTGGMSGGDIDKGQCYDGGDQWRRQLWRR